MSTLQLALIGGFVSFSSTVMGALSVLLTDRLKKLTQFKFTIDFALGLMLSAAAFSLVGPALYEMMKKPEHIYLGLLGFLAGGFMIYRLKLFIEHKQMNKASSVVLALSLFVHNLPEGMASGAALAGLELNEALPLLVSISLQNLPEGLLVVMCLMSMGFDRKLAIMGGVASGLIEFVGGAVSGFALSWSTQTLPVVLMIAGGAMLTATLSEIFENRKIWPLLKKPEFGYGLALVPTLLLFMG